MSLLLEKSKVIPSKGLFTIPRLELMSAVMATQLSKTLKTELDMENADKYFWIDSKISLVWIANKSKRFNTFVHNRVRLIKSRTSSSQWLYIPSNLNRGDIASWGRRCDQLINTMWFSGPKSLLETSPKLLQQPQEKTYRIDLSDPKLKKVQVLASAATPFITHKFTKFSTWGTLIR